MEPMLPEESSGLENLATDLVAKASTLAGKVNPVLAASIGDLVRSMNCYYSNLIEGHHTYPVDIDRALANDYAQEPESRWSRPSSSSGSTASSASGCPMICCG